MLDRVTRAAGLTKGAAGPAAKWLNDVLGARLGLADDVLDVEKLHDLRLAEEVELTKAIHERFVVEDQVLKGMESRHTPEIAALARRLGLDDGTTRGMVTDIIERKVVDDAAQAGILKPDEYKMVKRWAERSREQLDELDAIGRPVSALDEENLAYFHHLVTDEGLAHIAKTKPGYGAGKKVRRWLGDEKQPGFAKRRRLRGQSVSEINAEFRRAEGVDFDLFDTDPARVHAAREMAQLQFTTRAKFADDLARVFGSDEAFDGAVKVAGDKYVPAEIAEAAGKVMDLHAPRWQPGPVIGAYDKVNRWWSRWLLMPNPAYHARNGLSNFYQNWLAGVWHPNDYVMAGRLQTRAWSGKGLDELAFTDAAGQAWTHGDVLAAARRNKVLSEESFRHGVHGLDETRQLGGPATAMQKFKQKPHQGAIFLGEAVGRRLENNARLAHFVAKLKEGFDELSAGHSVKKHLFDYQELTRFEREVLKRAMPFYAWTRKNIPLQFEKMLTSPRKFVRTVQAKQEIEDAYMNGQPVPDHLMAEWLQRAFPIQIGSPAKGQLLVQHLQGFLPQVELNRLMAPVDEFVDMFSPIIKQAVEQATNVNLFRSDLPDRLVKIDNDIDREFLGHRWAPRLKHMLQAIPMLTIIDRANPGGVFTKWAAENQTARDRTDPDAAARAGHFWLGLRLYQRDMAKQQVRVSFDFKRKIQDQKREARLAMLRGDESARQDALEHIAKLAAEWRQIDAEYAKYIGTLRGPKPKD
jgi:hypothetical protein